MGVLLLIRHGRSTANVDGVLAGRAPGVMLDDVGTTTATALGRRLAPAGVRAVVTSPLERTRETAALAFPDIPAVIDERLVECDYGDWQGRPLSELATLDLWRDVQSRPDEVTFPNGESMANMARRAVECVRQWDRTLRDEHGDQVVWAAVSHGDVIKAIVADALGLPLRNFQSLMVEPASVSVIRFGTDSAAVVKWNDAGEGWVSSLAYVPAQSTPGGEAGA